MSSDAHEVPEKIQGMHKQYLNLKLGLGKKMRSGTVLSDYELEQEMKIL